MHLVKLRILYASLALVLFGGWVLALGVGSYNSTPAPTLAVGTPGFSQLVGTLQRDVAASPDGFSSTANQDTLVAEPLRHHRWEQDDSGWGDD